MKIHSLDDCLLLQADIHLLVEWCTANGLPLNEKKCQVLSFHRTKSVITFDYEILGNKLSRPIEIRDLGVIFDPTLSFTRHIDTIIGKSMALMGFVIRSSKEFIDPYTTKSLYCSIVRSTLEYASVLWAPSYPIHIKRIESIQKRFLLFALRSMFPPRDFESLPPYVDRLQLLNLPRLATRRMAADLVFFYKILVGEIDSQSILSRINLNVGINRRLQNNLIYTHFYNTNYGMHQPLGRMERSFNNVRDLDFNMSVSRVRALALDHFR